MVAVGAAGHHRPTGRAVGSDTLGLVVAGSCRRFPLWGFASPWVVAVTGRCELSVTRWVRRSTSRVRSAPGIDTTTSGRLRMPANDYEYWSAGPGAVIVGVILLAVAVWAYAAYRKMRSDRERTLGELADARLDLDESRRELREAHRSLEEARRDWQEAVRRLTARLDEHDTSISEVIRGLKQWQEDRKKLGLGSGWEMRAVAVIKGGQGNRKKPRQQAAGLQAAFNSGVDRLRHLIERMQDRGSSGSEDEPPVQP